jgi:DNA ligase (NAD+)
MNNSKLLSKLEKAKNRVKDKGDFVGASPKGYREDIYAFIDEYCEEKRPSKSDNEIAETILRIGKSFYDYSKEGMMSPWFIDDKKYDKLRSRWVDKHGFIEPVAYLPKGVEKIEVNHELLTNNMNKVFRINDSDDLVEGVGKEGNRTIEDWFSNVWKTLSLDKDDEIKITMTPKIDGVSVNSKVKAGKLKSPATRGDYSKAPYLKALEGMAVSNPFDEDGVAQYEAFTTNAGRVALSKLKGDKNFYKTNRSAASGFINTCAAMNEEQFIKDGLEHVSFYPILYIDKSEELTYSDIIDDIDKLGINVPSDMLALEVVKGNKKELLEAVTAYFKDLMEKRDDLSYSVDGIVITVVKDSLREKLGRDGHTNNYQISLKPNPSNTLVTITSIYLSSGDKGRRTPMVDFKPVVVDGREFSSAKFASKTQFNEMGVSIGDKVKLIIAGDVIPAISAEGLELSGSYPVTDFEICPSCYESLKKSGNYTCENTKCLDNIKGKISNFLEVLELKGYGENFAAALVDSTLSATTLLHRRFDPNAATIKEIEGRGFKSALDSIQADIEKAMKNIEPHQLIDALGISNISAERAKLILSKISFDKILKLDLDYKTLLSIPGIGNKLADSIGPAFVEVWEDLKYYAAMMSEENKNKDYSEDKTRIRCTGFEADKELKDIIKDLGWDIVDGSKFNILIRLNDSINTGSYKKAVEKGIKVYTKDEFLKEFKK